MKNNRGSIPERDRVLSLHQYIQTGSGTHTAYGYRGQSDGSVKLISHFNHLQSLTQ